MINFLGFAQSSTTSIIRHVCFVFQSEKLYHIFAVTNTAATHDHGGKWGEDNTLCVVYEGLQEGKKYREEIEIKILGSNEFAVNEKDILDGKVISTMNVFMRK